MRFEVHSTDLASLRPTDDSVAAITAARDRVTAALEAEQQAVAVLLEHRATMLLTASPAAILAHDQRVGEAKIRLEQLDALRAAIVAEVEPAQRREAREALRAELEAHARETAALVADLRAHYPRHAAAIGALLTRWHDGQVNSAALRRRLDREAQRQDIADLGEPASVGALFGSVQPAAGWRAPFQHAVMLPALPGDPDDTPFWRVELDHGVPRGAPLTRSGREHAA
jgi:hypothetical protein